MDSPAANNSLSLSPCTTVHDSPQSKCGCWLSGSLVELPFLHTIVETAPHSYVARGYSSICRTLCWFFRLFPVFIRRILYMALKGLDGLFLLLACYAETAHPWASVHLWGSKKVPGAVSSARRRTPTAGMCIHRALHTRLRSKLFGHADEDIADAFRPSLDTHTVDSNHLLRPVHTIPAELMTSEDEAEGTEGNDRAAEETVKLNKPETGSEARVSMISTSEDLITLEDGSHKGQGIEVDDKEIHAPDYEGSVCTKNTIVGEANQPFDDESYVSADENLLSTERGHEHHSAQQPQMHEVVRSIIFEPLDLPKHSEIARPPLLAVLTASTHSLPLPTLPSRQSEEETRLSSFPSLQTFDDIPGLRRQSLSGVEAKRLVTISAKATSQAHHHWLRPCAACARKAGAEGKSWHLLSKKAANNTREDASSEVEHEPGVYKQTVQWVKKQEDRIKRL